MTSVLGWTFLVLVVLALAVASVLRRRPGGFSGDRRASSRPTPPAGTLPASSGNETLGLSSVRPAVPRAEPVAVPRAQPVAVPRPAPTDPEVRPEPSRAWSDEEPEPSWTFDGSADPEPAAPLATATRESAARESAARETDEPAPDAAPAHASPVPTPHSAPLSSARPAPSAVHPESPLWDPPGPAEHLLASLAACTGGTVAVLRHDGERYHVDALAGLAVASWPAPLDARGGEHPLDRAPLDRLLSILDGDDLDALTYLAPGAAQTALIRALDETEPPRVLVATTLAVGAERVDLATARLVGDYVDLLATLRADTPPLADADDEYVDTHDAPAPHDAAEPDDDDERSDDRGEARPAERREPEPLPRSVILTGEIAAARDARRDLAFALVTLADAEDLLDGPAGPAANAEAALEARLRAAARVRRVEPFGPLLYGVFLDAAPDQVAPWARALSGTGPALHIGAVAPASGGADAVRDMATLALEDAYAQRVVCVVLD